MIRIEKCDKLIKYLKKEPIVNLNILGIINNISEA